MEIIVGGEGTRGRVGGSGRRWARGAEMRKVRQRGADYALHSLHMYSFPPKENITLVEFQSFAVDRLKVLKAVEAAGQRFPRGSQEYNGYLDKELKQPGLDVLDTKGSISGVLDDATKQRRRKDHISHFILRLAFCRSPDTRRWFLQQETDLFKFRFAFLASDDSRNVFMKTESTLSEYELLPLGDDPDLLEKVSNSCFSMRDNPSTLRKQQCCMTASKYFGFIQEEERLGPLLKHLSNKTYLGKDYGGSNTTAGKVTPKEINELAETSFPLCMRQLHQHLKKDHHLKHGGRMQYGLFLKGIGLSLEDALQFWKTEFSKTIDADKFEKNYAYNIRHNYGKEGKRKDYTPYSCQKIINSNPPGPQDAHGCPFKHCDSQLLRQRLEGLKLSGEQSNKIVGLSKSGLYDQACSRFFEYTHQIPEHALNQLISHPNHYFDESRKYRSGEKKITGDLPEAEYSQCFETSTLNTTSETTLDTQVDVGDDELATIDLDNIE